MRSVPEALAWLEHESKHPTANRKGLCCQTSRLAYGLPVIGASAKAFWNSVPAHEKHYTSPDQVPVGAFCVGLMTHQFGHIWVAAGHGKGWSIDVKRSGKIDLVDLPITEWTHDTKCHWTTWTPFGHLPIHVGK